MSGQRSISTTNGKVFVRMGKVEISEESGLLMNVPKGERCVVDLENQGEVKIVVEAGAVLEINELYDEGERKVSVRISCERDAVVKRKVISLCAGGSFSVGCDLNGEGAEFGSEEVRFSAGAVHAENKIEILHNASETKSRVEVREALRGSSRSFTHGRVRIGKEIKNANTFLSAHALFLDEGARARSIPAVEIESADVQAGHAASVSTVDQDQLFYLMSRGLSRTTAEKEIVKGFLGESEKMNNFIEGKWQEATMLNE